MERARLTALVLCLCTSVAAQARDKDFRTMTDAQGETEVGFCARPSPDVFGFPGHAFVTFSAQRNGGRDFRAVGHTVAAGTGPGAVVISYFNGSSVTGKQAEERYTSLKQACLTLKVDRADYTRALTAAQPTLTAIGIPADVAASAESYALGSDDCITFAERVAKTLKPAGLAVPTRVATDTPFKWISKLIAANP